MLNMVNFIPALSTLVSEDKAQFIPEVLDVVKVKVQVVPHLVTRKLEDHYHLTCHCMLKPLLQWN